MILKNRPRIGVTGPDKGGAAAWIFTALSIIITGGVPKRITPSSPRNIEGLDGLVIGGGADVDPDAYEKENFIDEYLNETLRNKRKSLFRRITSFFNLLFYPFIFIIRRIFSRKSHKLDKSRDKLEFNLASQAIKKSLPVLGICRGAQLINVYFKGDLHQDINSFYIEKPNKVSIFPVKKVYFKKGCKLSEIVGQNELAVNAIHNQAVKNPGETIDIVAKEANGVVQAIESAASEFVIGVQWHPEYLVNRNQHRKIFRALIEHAKNKKKLGFVHDTFAK